MMCSFFNVFAYVGKCDKMTGQKMVEYIGAYILYGV